MSSGINYEALAGSADILPPDGNHTAMLVSVRRTARKSDGSPLIVTDWETVDDSRYQWTTFYNFKAQGMPDTTNLLHVICNSMPMTDEELDNALYEASGRTFVVRTKAWGDDGTGRNTHVIEAADLSGEQIPIDMPGDEEPARTPGQEPVAVPDEDDIPF